MWYFNLIDTIYLNIVLDINELLHSATMSDCILSAYNGIIVALCWEMFNEQNNVHA
jgi:hypothetical protein